MTSEPTGLRYIIEAHRLGEADAWGVDVLDARSPSADGTSYSAIGKAADTDLLVAISTALDRAGIQVPVPPRERTRRTGARQEGMTAGDWDRISLIEERVRSLETRVDRVLAEPFVTAKRRGAIEINGMLHRVTADIEAEPPSPDRQALLERITALARRLLNELFPEEAG